MERKGFKRYFAKHFQVGTCKYKDKVVFIDNPTIKQSMGSFDGKPVYIEHQEVDGNNLKEQSDGAVVKCFYNEIDGWYWLEFLTFTEEIDKKINMGWSVSNAYAILKKGEGGTWHNNEYDFEVLELEFNHLAVVETPRYEQSCIMTPEQFKKYNEEEKLKLNELQNSIIKKENKNGGKGMFKLFSTKKESLNIDDNVAIQLENGKDVSLSDMVKCWNEAEEEKKKEEEKKENECGYPKDDDVVKIGDNEVSIKELKENYRNMMKKNELTEEEKKIEEEKLKKEEEENKKKNESEEEKKEEEENKNSKEFYKLKNAKEKNENIFETEYLTQAEKIANGKKRY
ncbi:DUF2213 domain-containing protein [Candidatus Gracilibacteria bacterium]|nr:DUF2213 domain-containing protein [Candidatus Gracilibacteria bacterium]